MKLRAIRAEYNNETITVYQAFNEQIALAAIKNQTFAAPFKLSRMTWIKPSFLWMMYRSGWATKKDQEYILKIKIKRSGFDWALQNSCLSHFDKTIHPSKDEWKLKLKNTPVRVQWDPDRNLQLQPLEHRAIQIGLSGVAVYSYIKNWIVSIEDITPLSKQIRQLVLTKNIEAAKALLPIERIYGG